MGFMENLLRFMVTRICSDADIKDMLLNEA